MYVRRVNLAEFLAERSAIVQAIAQTAEGWFRFDIRDQGVGWAIATGSYEPIETAFVKRLLQPGDLAIDAGANLGWYTTIMAQAVGPNGTVLAFEPEEYNLDLLRTNLATNAVDERVRVFGCALYERDGEIELELSPENYGDHRVRAIPGAPKHGDHERGIRTYRRVPARTLDGILSEIGLSDRPIRLLKVDTQGAEVAIFRGAARTLAATVAMTAEFWPYGLERAGATTEEYVEHVARHFSQFARLNTADPRMLPIAELRRDMSRAPDMGKPKSGFSNYVFVK